MPPPTIAAMPTMAKLATSIGNGTCSAFSAAAKAPPIAAPMNSEGEKMPPEEPEPRLTEVANSLATNRNSSKAPSIGRLVPSWPVRIASIVA